MKTFHIKPPRAGERSASIVGYSYDAASRRTRTHYLGSIRIDADPDEPELALRLRPGATLGDSLFELKPGHLREIAEWLSEHGTYRTELAARLAALERAERKGAERDAVVRAAVAAEVRQELEASWKAAFDEAHRAQPEDPLARLDAYLANAASHLVAEAERLRNRGIKLSSRRSANTDISKCATPLDELQARANRIRVLLGEQFAESCKRAGLMASRQRRNSKRGN